MLAFWDLVEADLHQTFGIDVEDRTMMARRSWRWLQVRVRGLVDAPPAYVPVPFGDEQQQGVKLLAIPQTRLGYALYPPGLE